MSPVPDAGADLQGATIMSRPLQFQRESRDYLLVPSMPTPNGRLHLGHIAGPFLKLDVLARYLRSRSARAHVMTGVDCYESYVLLQADREQRSPAEVAAHYTQRIVEDLEALHLVQDGFIDPRVSPGKEIYEQCNLWTVHRLLELGAARYQSRKHPYSKARQRFVPRSYVLGTCRCCGQDTSGSVCEPCGRQHVSDDLLAPRFRDGDTSVEWREVATLSMRVADKSGLMNRFRAMAIPERVRTILATHVDRFDAEMELTIPGAWGLPWEAAPDRTSQMVFTYFIYAWALAVGELYRQHTGAARNAFDAGSNVVTVFSYGIDITIASVFSTVAFAHLDRAQKAYTHYLSNEFLRLHGEKFSTSRGHVISGTDLVRKTPATADAIRYYLATISPDDEETDFHVDGFIATNNQALVEGTWRTVRHALESLSHTEPASPSSGFIEAFEDALRGQSDDCDVERFRIGRMPGRIQEWTRQLEQAVRLGQDVYWFLKGLAILAGPLVPEFSGRLWRKLGGQGEPDLERFMEHTRVQPRPLEPLARPLSRADLLSCLPGTLLESGAMVESAAHAPT
jgi:methionyl-tRNA synthetase